MPQPPFEICGRFFAEPQAERKYLCEDFENMLMRQFNLLHLTITKVSRLTYPVAPLSYAIDQFRYQFETTKLPGLIDGKNLTCIPLFPSSLIQLAPFGFSLVWFAAFASIFLQSTFQWPFGFSLVWFAAFASILLQSTFQWAIQVFKYLPCSTLDSLFTNYDWWESVTWPWTTY